MDGGAKREESGGRSSIEPARLEALRRTAGSGPVLILTHDNPDPDALASGKALAVLLEQKWGIGSELAFFGLVTRAENQAMLELLTPEWLSIDSLADLNLADYSAIALVDTQPASGNNILPADFKPDIVIDHHGPYRETLQDVTWTEVRDDVGATVCLVYLLLEAAGIIPDEKLATAIFYAIQTDTRSLTRSSSAIDQEIYFRMLPRIDREVILQVEQARLPREYFKSFVRGLQSARVIGRAVVSYLGKMHRPDFVAELADFLIRLDGVEAALCLGHHKETMYLSLRISDGSVDAGKMIQQIIVEGGHAGGHGMIAGGRVALGEVVPDELAVEIERRFLVVMDEAERPAEALLS